MKYNFDEKIDRHGSSCIKFDFAKERGHSPNELSFWVADMDFCTASEILDALHERINHGIFGYTDPDTKYFETVAKWIFEHHSYEINPEWISVTPGVVFSIGVAIEAFTQKGESVLIQPPVYYPFSWTTKQANRKIVENPLIWKENRYEIDFEDFEKKIESENVRLFLLCNPHNPGGRSWTKDELSKMAEICQKHGVLVFSDEIHEDFVWGNKKHVPFASISKETEKICITATSPSKSFNIAGLQISNNIISDKNLKEKWQRAMDMFGYSQPNVLGLTACQAAYTHGEVWLNEVRAYIEKNLQFASDFIQTNIPKAIAPVPEATYLLWIDFKKLGLSDKELNRRITEGAGLWLDAGRIFGKSGKNFQRINVATSRAYLTEGLERLAKEFQK